MSWVAKEYKLMHYWPADLILFWAPSPFNCFFLLSSRPTLGSASMGHQQEQGTNRWCWLSIIGKHPSSCAGLTTTGHMMSWSCVNCSTSLHLRPGIESTWHKILSWELSVNNDIISSIDNIVWFVMQCRWKPMLSERVTLLYFMKNGDDQESNSWSQRWQY
jgi:hypothetical protein